MNKYKVNFTNGKSNTFVTSAELTEIIDLWEDRTCPLVDLSCSDCNIEKDNLDMCCPANQIEDIIQLESSEKQVENYLETIASHLGELVEELTRIRQQMR